MLGSTMLFKNRSPDQKCGAGYWAQRGEGRKAIHVTTAALPATLRAVLMTDRSWRLTSVVGDIGKTGSAVQVFSQFYRTPWPQKSGSRDTSGKAFIRRTLGLGPCVA